jgi:putative copper resistance protein D
MEATIASVIDIYAMDLFWMHRVEHLVLIMVVPVFLVLGHPLTAIRNALGSPARERFEGFLKSRPMGVLTSPMTGLLVYTVVIIGTHLTDFMDKMAMHAWVMTFEQVLYVVAGCWMFMPLLAFEPLRRNVPYVLRLVVLFLAMVPDAVVGVVLLQTNDNLFPMMMSMHPSWAPDPVRDINTAGALMWAAGDGLMMFIAVGVMLAMISDPDKSRQGFGTWLEGARRRTLAQHVNLAEEAGSGFDPDLDPDGDEALAAYNRMLGRLGTESPD